MPHLVAFALPDNPGFGESLRFQLVGFTIVMIVLATLWLLIRLVGACFQMAGRRVKPLPAKTAPTPAADGAPSPEIVAVIAAAVHSSVAGAHRVVAIQTAPPSLSALNINAWSVEGRRQIFSSHSVR